jgi:hypothetical protein
MVGNGGDDTDSGEAAAAVRAGGEVTANPHRQTTVTPGQA